MTDYSIMRLIRPLYMFLNFVSYQCENRCEASLTSVFVVSHYQKTPSLIRPLYMFLNFVSYRAKTIVSTSSQWFFAHALPENNIVVFARNCSYP